MNFKKTITTVLVVAFFSTKSFAQFTATWAFTSNNSSVKAGLNQADIAIADALIGSAFTSNIGYGSNGIKCQPTSGTDWVTAPTDGWHIDFPISPVGGVDATLLGLTFAARTSGSSGNNMVSLAVQKDGTGAFIPFGTPQSITSGGGSTITFPAFAKKLYANHTYTVRMYLYAAGSGTSASRSLSIKNAVYNGSIATAGTQPSVTTATAIKTGKYTGTATGVVTAGTYTITSSGVVWDVAANPTVNLSTKNTSGPTTSGNINLANGGAISDLTAATTYNIRAYVESETGDVFYGVNLTFTTDAPTVANLTTNVITSITSIKATSGGVIIDSGGVGITEKGVCWNTSPNPTILNSKTIDGAGNTAYSSLLKILTPNTNYCVRAYAKNSIGVGYGNEICFTTLNPEPVVITTTPNGQNSIPFGNVIINNISAVKSYTLSASALIPASGNITITAPNGFQVSTNSGSGFASTINVAYTAGTIAATTIYVRFVPTQFGDYSGTITHSGGGATSINIDDVSVNGKGIQNPGDLTNVGTDFWTGFGYQSNMDTKPTNADAANISIFVATGNQSSTVVVDLPNMSGVSGFPKTYTIPANSVQEISGFPIGSVDEFNSGNTSDTRLYYTGTSNRGIHIYSTDNVPVSVWMYTYTKNNSAGASMIFPTNTWGASYAVQSFGGPVNGSPVPNAFFYVIAKEDNTQFEFTPTADILDSSTATLFKKNVTAANVKYPKNITQTITLNKGQIFNAMGYIQSNEGVDLSGTTVRSLDCNKKIAVFGGNGRVLVNTPTITNTLGSDNLVQQMFPKAAWGTKYLTVPTKTMEQNLYRVFVDDPNTLVWLNTSTHTAATALQSTQYDAQGKFYFFENNLPNLIESNKPVSVIQFIIAGNNIRADIGNGGKGDPEMIILSSTKQAINNATVYSANFKNGKTGGSYINIVMKKDGIASFKLDGLTVADTGLSSYSTVGVPAIYGPGTNPTIPMTDVFLQHPYDTNYYYAKIRVESGLSHTISSDKPFNAIAYGMSDGESYGYNAGTNLKPENQFLTVQNPYANLSNDSVVPTCVNNDFTYKIFLPYKPSSMHWDFFNNPAQQPNADTILVTNPTPVDSVTVNGTMLYKYTLPTNYSFNTTGSFPVNVTVNATNADGCSGLQTITFNVKVVDPPIPYFLLSYGPCLTAILNYTDSSYDKNGYKMAGREWTFYGLGSDIHSTDSTPTISYFNPGTYSIKLRAINAIGCYKDSTTTVTLFGVPTITKIAADNVGPDCVGRKITFTATATTPLGTIVKYYWNFGDGKKDTTTTNTTSHTFTAVGTGSYTISLVVETNNGCPSAVFNFTQPIYQVVANFNFTSPQCINTPVTFTDASTGEVTSATIDTKWKWSFGDAANTTATTQNASFTYNTAGTYQVKLQTELVFGATTLFCDDDSTKTLVINDVLSKPVVGIDNTATTTSSLTYKWNGVANATAYQVSFNGGSWITPSSGATGLLHTATGLNQNTNYTICVKALGACPSDSTCFTAKTAVANSAVFIPNVFTPDGNGLNDKLIVCSNNIKSVQFAIYSQWGEKLFETSAPAINTQGCYEVWDGKAFGKMQPVGVYAYVSTIVMNDGKVVNKKGLVNLVR